MYIESIMPSFFLIKSRASCHARCFSRQLYHNHIPPIIMETYIFIVANSHNWMNDRIHRMSEFTEWVGKLVLMLVTTMHESNRIEYRNGAGSGWSTPIDQTVTTDSICSCLKLIVARETLRSSLIFGRTITVSRQLCMCVLVKLFKNTNLPIDLQPIQN